MGFDMEKIKVVIWSFIQISKISVYKLILKIVLAISASVVPVIIVMQIGKIIDSVAQYAKQGVTSFHDIAIPILLLAGLLVANSFFFYGSGIVTSFVNVTLGIRLKRRLIDCVRWFPAQSFLDNTFCDEYENASSGIDNVSDIADNLFSFVGSLFSFVISLVVIAKVSIWFAMPVIIFFIIGYRMNMRSKQISHNTWVDQTASRRYTSYLAGLFFDKQTAKEIKTYQIDNMIIGKWSALMEQIRNERLDNDKKANSFFAYYHIFMDACGIFVLLLAIYICKQGNIGVGEIVVVWQLSRGVLKSVQEITSSYSDIYYENQKIGIAKTFIDKSATLASNVENKYERDEMAIQENVDFDLENVCFSYHQGKEILHSIDLKIREGETVAVFGENGSGKSSLINIMIGLCKPDKGKVLIKGQDAEDVKDGIVGMAFQDFVCYPFSFRENIGFGYVNKIDDDHSIKLASEQGGADELLAKCGIDGLLSKIMEENGVELSGGEWQRVALSRANMGQKPLLVFDEPSAKLDPVSELVQFQNLKRVFCGRTIILVSHRVGFAKLADRIIVLKDGRIIEDGPSELLIKKDGEFKRMYDEQAKWYDMMWEQEYE